MSATEWSLLVLLSLIWGGAFFFGKVALRELPPLTVTLGRCGIAAIALNLWVLASGRRMPRDPRIWRQFATMGFINNVVPFSLILWAQTHITSSLASILNATTPLFTVLLVHWLDAGEKLTARRLAGVGLGIAGVALTIGHDALSGLGEQVPAELAVLAAALSYGFAGIYGRRLAPLGGIVAAAGQVSASSVFILAASLTVDRPWTLPSPHLTTWLALLGFALLATALAYVIYFRLLASVGPTNLLLVTFLIPVSAILLGCLVLGETLELANIAGMALVFAGLAAIDGRPLAWLGRWWRLSLPRSNFR